ncbi:hypothetical protein OG241_45970 [Streptomyces sp. NBC_01390]|uniref:hypothetical protein n=1 Tax=Streptomyces sp. NBC_01390 TaxID=2903850 RepID=UPI003246BF6C
MTENEKLEEIAIGLIDILPSWRLRAIERIDLSSELWAEHVREIHVKEFPNLVTSLKDSSEYSTPTAHDGLRESLTDVQSEDPDVKEIDLILPIAYLPRVPILDLRITVAEKQVYRIPLDEGSWIHAKYVGRLAKVAGFEVSEILLVLLSALFYFPSKEYGEFWNKYNQLNVWSPGSWYHWSKGRVANADPVREYLKECSSILGFKVDKSTYETWKGYSSKIGKIVRKFEPADYKSSCENPLVALPQFAREMRRLRDEKVTKEMITDVLEELRKVLREARKKQKRGSCDERKSAKGFLSTYAINGLRWMVFAKCAVPRNEKFIVTLEETRPIHFTAKWHTRPNRGKLFPITGHYGKTAWKMISFNDAETNHLSIRVSDTAVKLHHERGDHLVLGDKCEPIREHPDEEEKTAELYLRQDSTPDRPKRIWVKCHLRLTRLTSAFLYLAMAITGGAIALLIWRGVLDSHDAPPRSINEMQKEDFTHGITAKDAAVILIPVAFVAAFLLVRETSTLAMRIKRLRHSFLLVELFVLLATATSLYFWRLIWATP